MRWLLAFFLGITFAYAQPAATGGGCRPVTCTAYKGVADYDSNVVHFWGVSAASTAAAAAVETAIGSLTVVASAADIPDEAPAGLVAGAYPPAIAAALAGLAATMTDGAVAQNVLPVAQRIQINLSATGEAVG